MLDDVPRHILEPKATITDWRNPIPVAVGAFPVEGNAEQESGRPSRISPLMIRRANAPIGGIALPGGFVNEGETAEIAVAREFHEECGILTDPSNWRLVCSKITPRNQLLLFLQHRLDTNPMRFEDALKMFAPNEEVSEILMWEPTLELCFSLHADFLNEYL
jgi:8-oxo-dGTP pyrophosphatase MutT (NUDIX family)